MDGINTALTGNKDVFRHDGGGNGVSIGLGVKDLATWAHELTHAADNRNGRLTVGGGQKTDNEYVAELGGCVLLSILGFDVEANTGGCFEYLSMYAEEEKGDVVQLALSFLERTCEAVNLILAEAEKLNLGLLCRD